MELIVEEGEGEDDNYLQNYIRTGIIPRPSMQESFSLDNIPEELLDENFVKELRSQAFLEQSQSNVVITGGKSSQYKKTIRLIAAGGYIVAVSLAGILVGLYYAIFWDFRHTPLVEGHDPLKM
ncbi:uncharacterized protein LOC142340045 [Convolutriloba macropyga]|uniref:uncharacterized protein LOC142340045 n=1 Tax=Convolutriloba macropyga TaxID=536237 RepID=UPI003F51C7D0